MEVNELNGSEDKPLKIEAEEAVKEIAFAVEHVSICKALESSDDLVFLNLQTKEGDLMCVELSIQGFRVSELLTHSSLLFALSGVWISTGYFWQVCCRFHRWFPDNRSRCSTKLLTGSGYSKMHKLLKCHRPCTCLWPSVIMSYYVKRFGTWSVDLVCKLDT